ncbi:MAG: hypothetical protein V1782_10215, partial [Pseudomonadota bacterium]
RDDLDRIELCALVKTNNPAQDIVGFLSTPLNQDDDPLIQLTIFRSQHDTLCLKANHIVTDAGGVKEYLRLLTSIYRELVRDPEYRPPANLLGRRSHRQITERLSIPAKLRILLRSVALWRGEMSPSCNWSFPSQGRDLSMRTFLIQRIQPEAYERIKAYSTLHRCTINDIMTAAFYRAFSQLLRPRHNTPLRLGMTVDLRRYRPDNAGEAITNLAALFLLNIGTRIGDSFEETVHLVQQRMNLHKKKHIGLELTRTSIFNFRWLPFAWGRRLIALVGKMNLLWGPESPPPWVTNMGILKTEDLSFGDVGVTDAFLTAPVAFPPFFAVGLSGFQNTLTMSAGFCSNSTDPQDVKRFFRLVEENLP